MHQFQMFNKIIGKERCSKVLQKMQKLCLKQYNSATIAANIQLEQKNS